MTSRPRLILKLSNNKTRSINSTWWSGFTNTSIIHISAAPAKHTDAIDADHQGFYAISDGVYQQFYDLFDKHEAPYLYGDGRNTFYEFKII